MKETMKEIFKSSIIGIGMSMAIFCIIGITFDVRFGGQFSMENYQFTKMVIGCVLVGLGFGIPSVVYNKESLPMPIKFLIHMGIGCVVYTITAYNVGWIGNTSSILQNIVIVLVQLAVAFIIWLFFMMFYRREAQKMNEKLQTMKDKK